MGTKRDKSCTECDNDWELGDEAFDLDFSTTASKTKR